ncbi:hypothetical protein ACFQDN_12275 [Pseudomonas asuensis]
MTCCLFDINETLLDLAGLDSVFFQVWLLYSAQRLVCPNATERHDSYHYRSQYFF